MTIPALAPEALRGLVSPSSYSLFIVEATRARRNSPPPESPAADGRHGCAPPGPSCFPFAYLLCLRSQPRSEVSAKRPNRRIVPGGSRRSAYRARARFRFRNPGCHQRIHSMDLSALSTASVPRLPQHSGTAARSPVQWLFPLRGPQLFLPRCNKQHRLRVVPQRSP